MTYFFDGKSFARKMEESLALRVRKLARIGKTPVLASILVGDDPASLLYLSLKKKAAERVGCKMIIFNFPTSAEKSEIIAKIQELNNDKSINGIMIQLPLPSNFSLQDRDEIIATIGVNKDVDGLLADSIFVPATANAVISVLKESEKIVHFQNPTEILVVGGSGFIGRQIVKAIRELDRDDYMVDVADSKTKDLASLTPKFDVLISATGKRDLIKPEMVREGSVLIDVGSPNGDFDKESYKKGSFVSPSPGGVGPLTICFLLENLTRACEDFG
jgi:methylenetetrahydrofolate dehydrogenase (NADP+)/methenyltetrahydrofolate cyclohydrolase